MYAIKAENISKVYRFYQKPVYRLLEAIVRKPMHKAFSALDDVSFSVSPGETLGIVGENGAGKSTLLKILARTLSPSGGSLEINGRVSALLELGAGFHQDLTGRENIYLNASLMGLSEKEISSREHEIVDFADIGEFIDRPIKTYSSGMAVRLGFSIATCVDPDILIVDEALSVGDQRFQQKCVERMLRFRTCGKTIIVCSHSMYLINEMCSSSVWLDKGRIIKFGETSKIVSSYLAFLEEKSIQSPNKLTTDDNNLQELTIKEIQLFDANGAYRADITQFSCLTIKIVVSCNCEEFMGQVAVIIENQQEDVLFSTLSKLSELPYVHFINDTTIELTIPSFVLQKGVVRARCLVSDKDALRVIDEHSSPFFPIVSKNPEYGLVWMEHFWTIKQN